MKHITRLLILLMCVTVFLSGCNNENSPFGNHSKQNASSESSGTTSSSASLFSSEPQPEPEPPKPEPDRSAEPIYLANPDLTPVNYDSPALLAPSDKMSQEYMDSLVFLCDSPTFWMKPFGLLKDGEATTQIWTGPEGTMTLAYQSSYAILDPYDQVERPIRDVVALHKPERMVIALGINGIMFMDEEYFVEEYTDLVTSIQKLSPDTTILLQSIYPITPAYKQWGAITNVMITETNSWILKIAEDTGCKYLDTFSVLVNEKGNAKPELMMKDGLHPNEDGLLLILDYIRTHGYLPE